MYIQYTNPEAYPPLEHSSQILADAGWQVLFLGTDAFGSSDLNFPLHPSIRVFRLPYVAGGWRQKVHYCAYFLWVLTWTLRWRPDWLYASDSLACPVALGLSYLSSAKVIYHEHDSPAGGGYPTQLSWFMRFVMQSRKKLAEKVELNVLPNQERADLFQQLLKTKKPVLTIWNCPRIEEVTPEIRRCNDGKLRILYQGSIVPSRLPMQVLEALTMLPESVELGIIGYTTIGNRNYVHQLQTRAIELGLASRVTVSKAMPRHRLLIECRKFDVGLAFVPASSEDINLKQMLGASNKVFDYMASGLVLLVADLPDWQQAYVEPGYGLSCNPLITGNIAQILQWLIDHPNDRYNMAQQGRQRILDEWNYERQFKPLVAVLET